MWRLESNTDSSKEDGQSLKRKEHRSPKGTKNAKLSNMWTQSPYFILVSGICSQVRKREMVDVDIQDHYVYKCLGG
jgi:hypothetical protein